jgi:predicted PurR-regulated permease PerM
MSQADRPSPVPETPPSHAPQVGRGLPGPPPGGERRTRQNGWRSRDVLRATALVLGLYYFLRLLWFTSPLVLTAFLGVLFALAVSAGVDVLQRYRIPRGLGAALIVFGSVGLLIGIGAWVAPTLRTQGREIQRQLPSAIDKLEEWGRRRGGLIGAVLSPESDSVTVVAPAPGDTAREAPGAAAPEQAQPGQQPGEGQLRGPPQVQVTQPESLRERVMSAASRATRYLFPFLSTTVTIVGGFLLLMVLTIYIAAEPEAYRKGLMHLFPHRTRAKAGEVLSAIGTVLRKWLITQLIAMAVIGTVTTVVLLLLDVRAAFALGVIAGLLEFIPTLGPIIAAVPALAMGFLDSPEKALYVLIAYVAIQQLENHILIPMLMKEGVDLPPVVTILSQGLMAILFGFLGMLVAVPLMAAVMVPIKMLYVRDVVGDDISILDEDDD